MTTVPAKTGRFLKTLVADKADLVVQKLGDNLLDGNNDEESQSIRCNNIEIQADITNKVIQKILNQKLDFTNVLELWKKSRLGKDDEASIESRNKGNDYLKIDQVGIALECYNQAVLQASPRSLNLALALANRSVALAKVRLFKEVIEDINLVLESNKYPEENSFKLYQRLANAHQALHEYELANKNFDLMIKAIDSAKISIKQKAKIVQEAQTAKAATRKCMIAMSFTNLKPEPKGCLIPFKHDKIENASGKKMLVSSRIIIILSIPQMP